MASQSILPRGELAPDPDKLPSFTIAHISSPLVRSHLPGHHPSPHVRSRDALRLLKLAIDRAVECGADAIAVTGSVVAAPPPLRVCDANFYYPLEREPAMAEAVADYCAVRSVLEDAGLPYVVTPGA